MFWLSQNQISCSLAKCLSVQINWSPFMGFWMYPANRRIDKIKDENIYSWILCFPLQVPARLAGRITAQGPERRLPCCCAPGCPVSRGRSRSSTRTEESFRETGTGRDLRRCDERERTLAPWTHTSTAHQAPKTPSHYGALHIMGHYSSDNCRDCFIMQHTHMALKTGSSLKSCS